MPLEYLSEDVKKALYMWILGTDERAGLKLCIGESLYYIHI